MQSEDLDEYFIGYQVLSQVLENKDTFDGIFNYMCFIKELLNVDKVLSLDKNRMYKVVL